MVTESSLNPDNQVTIALIVSRFMMGDPSSELQQYLQLDGQPRVGMIMIWNGVFILIMLREISKRLASDLSARVGVYLDDNEQYIHPL